MAVHLSIEQLPLRGRVLIGSRLIRRRVLGGPGLPDAEFALSALDRIDAAVRGQDSGPSPHPPPHPGVPPLFRALEACSAPVQQSAAETVSALVRQCICSVAEDPWVAPLQVAIITRSDIDQIGSACAELGVAEHDVLPEAVLLRLTPVHALTLCEPRPTPEEQAR